VFAHRMTNAALKDVTVVNAHVGMSHAHLTSSVAQISAKMMGPAQGVIGMEFLTEY